MARNITRYEPMSEMMRSGLFPEIGNFFREFGMSPLSRGMELEPRMKIDVEETAQNYVVTAEVPGVNKDDISVDIAGNTVSIKAEMKEEKTEGSGSNMLHTERYYGEQMRSFTLPQEVDEAQAQAKYENGLLYLTLPKKQASGSKKLTIQ
jgi:HSP20 family protein